MICMIFILAAFLILRTRYGYNNRLGRCTAMSLICGVGGGNAFQTLGQCQAACGW